MLDFTNLYKLRKDLCDAIKSEDLLMLEKLLIDTEYVNLNFIDSDGQTPLHRSCRIGNLDIVKLLVTHGADLNLINRFGWYPIHIASYYGFTSIVLYLIEQSSSSSSVARKNDDDNRTNEEKEHYVNTTDTPESTPPSSPQSDSITVSEDIY